MCDTIFLFANVLSRSDKAPEPSMEEVKRDFKSWNLDEAVAKLRVRAGRLTARPGKADDRILSFPFPSVSRFLSVCCMADPDVINILIR